MDDRESRLFDAVFGAVRLIADELAEAGYTQAEVAQMVHWHAGQLMLATDDDMDDDRPHLTLVE